MILLMRRGSRQVAGGKGPLGADFHIAAPPESNTRVFNPDLLTQLLVKAGFAAYEHGEVILYSLPRM